MNNIKIPNFVRIDISGELILIKLVHQKSVIFKTIGIS